MEKTILGEHFRHSTIIVTLVCVAHFTIEIYKKWGYREMSLEGQQLWEIGESQYFWDLGILIKVFSANLLLSFPGHIRMVAISALIGL